VANEFHDELQRIHYHYYLDSLIDQFKKDMARWEMKLVLLRKVLKFLKKSQTETLVKTIESVLVDTDPSCSIFKMSLNPLRTGLVLLRVIDEIETELGYPEYSVRNIK
jgi:hypothetical protein